MCSKIQALEWSSEQDEILIDFVKNHECLYNVHLKDYRKTQLKNTLWHEIGEILKKTDTECSKRWAYVRDYYVRRRGKPGTGSSSEAAKKRSAMLSFLDSIPSSKRSAITNIVDTNNIENSADDFTGMNDTTDQNFTEEIENDNVRQPEKLHLPNENSTPQSSRANSESSGTSEATPKKRTTVSSTTLSFKFKHTDETVELLKQIAGKQAALDENDLFFASIAKIVKKLPERDQAEIRMQIGNLVGNAEIAYLSRYRSDYNRPQSQLSYTSSSNSRKGKCFSDMYE